MRPKGISVGKLLFFNTEKVPYTVKACNERYAVCVKAESFGRLQLYSIIDFQRGIRGTHNLKFDKYDFQEIKPPEYKYSIGKCLSDITEGDIYIPYTNSIPLDITRIL